MTYTEKPTRKPASKFGIDPKTGRLQMGRFSLPMPRSRGARLALGFTLVFLGCLGFLPILGFWMVPLGFVVLSQDLAFARRIRRHVGLWWMRRRRG